MGVSKWIEVTGIAGNRKRSINTDNIIYIEDLGNKTFIRMRDGVGFYVMHPYERLCPSICEKWEREIPNE